MRRLLAEAFGAGLFQRLRAAIGTLVDGLLTPTLDAGPCELVGTLAFPLPVMVMCDLLGVPSADRMLVRPRAMALAKAFHTSVSQEDRLAADDAVSWLRKYLGDLIDECARHPRGDLLSRLAKSLQGPQPLPREEVVDNAAFLLFAGFETTMNSLSVGCEALSRHPAEYIRVRADAALASSAVEEILRYDAPIQGVARIVREPLDVNGHTLQKGRVIVLLVGSANRDETQFVEPHRFDVGRAPNRHLTFGGGVHQCFGAALARAELSALVMWLSRHVARLELADSPQRSPDAAMRSFIRVSADLRSC